jgi:hypothetical protein
MSVHTVSAGAGFAPTRIGPSLNETFFIRLAGLPEAEEHDGTVPVQRHAEHLVMVGLPTLWAYSGGSCR